MIRGPQCPSGIQNCENAPKLTALFDAFPGKRYDLAIKEFSTEADPTTRSFRAVLSMVQPEEFQALPGMTAIVEVQYAAGVDVVGDRYVVPAVAVFADEAGASHVWLVDPQDNRVKKRAVETGKLMGTDSITIESGLEAGEVVAVTAVSRLREGMEVRPIDKVEF